MENSNNNNGRPARWRLWTAAGTAAGLSLIATAIISLQGGRAQATADTAPPAPQVSVATVSETDITAWDEFSGRLEAVERVEVRSRVAGAVQAIHFREGALVRQGDLLITIDPAPYQAGGGAAEAQVAAAQARLAQAQSEQARAQRLWEESAIAQRELEERVNAAARPAPTCAPRRPSLQGARLNLGYTQVRAPVAGRIGKVEITAGNLVRGGARALRC
jgi:multidrug efflux system membrane fusion protein